jgi:hypothetical protein
MPRLSLWKSERFSTDAQFMDKLIREQFVMGGTDIYIHKYLGSENNNIMDDATQPNYPNLSAQNIQDLLFLENRDRKYSKDIVRVRCHFNVNDLDLDLSQFGLMLSSAGTLMITVHLRDCVDTLGRKLMSGDVLEIPCMKEFYSMDETVPIALKRYYVVQTGSHPANGTSPTWWNHLWRIKCTPMVDSQEYSQIMNEIVYDVMGNEYVANGNAVTYGMISSSKETMQGINDAIISQAETMVPKSGYNVEPFWAPLFVNGDPNQGTLPPGSSPQQKWSGYNVGDGSAVDGYPVLSATEFPSNPTAGDYCLRTDYFPRPRLYRYSGKYWQFVENDVRTPLTNGTGQTQRDQFINNANVFVDSSNVSEKVIQNLSTLFRPDLTGNISIG